MQYPRALLLLFSCLLPATASLANELDRDVADHSVLERGGQDGGHTGGGGAFLRCEDSVTRKIFYSFWDLRSSCPVKQAEPKGDMIRLSKDWKIPDDGSSWPEAGEWVDVRKLKSYRHMLRKLKNWEYWAPNLTRMMRENLKRPLRVLATPYYIAPLAELQVAHGYENVQVAPGAFFQYERERLYLNIEIFNAAGIDSQAAMLLHEYLRRVQVRFKLSNFLLQHTVRKTILEKADWTFADEFLYGWLSCRRIRDSAFGKDRDQGELASEPMKQVSAAEAVREGLFSRILVNRRVYWDAFNIGKRFGEPPRKKPHPDHPDILGTCFETMPADEF